MSRTEIEHGGPSLLALAITFAALFLASLILGTALAGGEHFPSPFGPEGYSNAYFSQHAKAVAIRLQFFGLRVAGVFIALFGGLAASFFLALSALSQWVLAQTGLAASAGATRVLHWFAFATGGPGHVVPLGLLLAGISATAGLTRRLPRWMMIFGLVVAAIAELSSFALLAPAAAWLLPLARFPALVWLICAGALLPKGIPHAAEKPAT